MEAVQRCERDQGGGRPISSLESSCMLCNRLGLHRVLNGELCLQDDVLSWRRVSSNPIEQKARRSGPQLVARLHDAGQGWFRNIG
jgi:hypothetical protein